MSATARQLSDLHATEGRLIEQFTLVLGSDQVLQYKEQHYTSFGNELVDVWRRKRDALFDLIDAQAPATVFVAAPSIMRFLAGD